MALRRLPEKLYRIGEVMEHSGLSRQTLHFYATIGLISEKRRTPAGYRLFPPSVFALLDKVRRLKKKGYTLRQIRENLETHAPRQDVADNLTTDSFSKRGRSPSVGTSKKGKRD